MNENEVYLTNLVNDIGLKLHSSAHCTAIQCIRHSCFTVEEALLKKHFTLQEILDNMERCNQLLEKNRHLLHQHSARLTSIV